MKIKAFYFFSCLLMFQQTTDIYAQIKKAYKIEFYYISWTIKFDTDITSEEIKEDKNSTRFTLNDTSIINSILEEIKINKLEKSRKKVMDVRMVMDIYYNNGNIETISIGVPILVKEKLQATDTIKPPCIEYNNHVILGIFYIFKNKKIYKSNYTFAKHLIDILPIAKEYKK